MLDPPPIPCAPEPLPALPTQAVAATQDMKKLAKEWEAAANASTDIMEDDETLRKREFQVLAYPYHPWHP